MKDEDIEYLVRSKQSDFDAVFGERYGIKLMLLQGHVNPQGQGFVDVDFLFNPRMTAEAIEMMCENIAVWIGGELRGTVNIDFSGRPSIAIVVEFPEP